MAYEQKPLKNDHSIVLKDWPLPIAMVYAGLLYQRRMRSAGDTEAPSLSNSPPVFIQSSPNSQSHMFLGIMHLCGNFSGVTEVFTFHSKQSDAYSRWTFSGYRIKQLGPFVYD